MTKYSILTLALLLLVGCGEAATRSSDKAPATAADNKTAESATTEATPVAFNVEGAPTVELSVPDMTCEFSCVPQVRETLAKQAGVKDVKVVLATHTATVAVDKDKFDAKKAVAALVDLQFTNTKVLNSADATEADGGAASPEAPKS